MESVDPEESKEEMEERALPGGRKSGPAAKPDEIEGYGEEEEERAQDRLE